MLRCFRIFTLRTVAACLALLPMISARSGGASFTAGEADDSEILFLRVIREENGSRGQLVEAVRVRGRLKAPRSSLERGVHFELRDPEGREVGSGVVQREEIGLSLEHEELARPRELVRRPVVDFQREFTVRIPFAPGSSRVVLRHSTGGAPVASLEEDDLIGDFPIASAREERPANVAPAGLNEPVFKQLLNNGSNSNRINIVVLSEGYQVSQLVDFEKDAQKAADYLLSTPPWAAYRNYCNVFLIKVPSAESGSDHPSANKFKDTYFNSTFESYGIERLLTIPPNDLNGNYNAGAGKVQTLLRRFLPDYDLALMIVNDTTYGGSGGTPAIASVNQSSAEILVHEIGHSFAGLGDEYDTPFPGYPDIEEPNTTKEMRRDFIKWKSWILESTPIPTSETAAYSAVVGLFEGAHFHSVGWYRPKLNCLMNSLGVPFCEVCAEAHVLRTYRLIQPIDSLTPQPGLITLAGGASMSFEAVLLRPSTHSLRVSWALNGLPIPLNDSPQLTVRADDLGNGDHSVQLAVTDTTALVRNDPQSVLKQTRNWTMRVSGVVRPYRLGSVLRTPEGSIEFDLTGQEVFGVVVEASPDLDTWAPVFTSTVRGQTVRIVDRDGIGNGRRYYRAVKR